MAPHLERPFPGPRGGCRKIDCVSLSDDGRHLEWGSCMTKRGSTQYAPCTLSPSWTATDQAGDSAETLELHQACSTTHEPGNQATTRSLYGHVHPSTDVVTLMSPHPNPCKPSRGNSSKAFGSLQCGCLFPYRSVSVLISVPEILN